MQINLYGKPGDGKSYSAVFFILLFEIVQKRRVVTNILGINPEEINLYLNYLVSLKNSRSKASADTFRIKLLLKLNSLLSILNLLLPFKIPLFKREESESLLDHTELKLLRVMAANNVDSGTYDFSEYIKSVTNVDIKSPNFWYSPDFGSSSILQPGDVLLLDEARQFLGGDNKISERCISLINHHRHYTDSIGRSMDLYFISQQPAHLKREVSGNAQFTYNARRMLRAGKFKQGKFRLDYYDSNAGLTDIKKGDYYDFVEERLNPRIFKLYKSTQSANGFESSARLPTVWDIKFWFGLSLFKFWLPAFACCAILGAYSLFNTFKHPPELSIKSNKPVPAHMTAPNSVNPVNQPYKVNQPPYSSNAITSANPAKSELPSAFPDDSQEFRLIGFYAQGVQVYAMISDKDNRIRYISDYIKTLNTLSPEISYRGKTISYWTGPVQVLPQLKSKTDEKQIFSK